MQPPATFQRPIINTVVGLITPRVIMRTTQNNEANIKDRQASEVIGQRIT
mgnify:CR=1 FL=1